MDIKRQIRIMILLGAVCISSFIGGMVLRNRRIASGGITLAASLDSVIPARQIEVATLVPAATGIVISSTPSPEPTSAVASISSAQQVTISSVSGNASAKAVQLMNSNRDRSADIISRIYTTEKGIALTFQGIGTNEELKNVLDILNAMGATGTFFVSFEDLANNAENVRYIANSGHAIGLAVNTGGYLTTEDLMSAVLEAENTLRTQIGFSGAICLRQLTGSPSTMLRLVASAGGYTLLSQTRSVITDATVTLGSARLICAEVFGKSKASRGEIIHFELGRTNSATLVAAAVRMVMTEYTELPALALNDMLEDLQDIFDYPLTSSNILSTVRGKVRAGQLAGDSFEIIQSRYIGIDWMKTEGYLPGFTRQEISQLDRTGIIKNERDMVFLTFDGWGTDDRVEELLKVLKNHDVKATFFIRTEDAEKNPALLREIGLAGHTIGSNTHTGMSLATYKSANTFVDLTADKVKELREDLVKSYTVLEQTVGDLTSGGKPVLSTLFRPYLLAVSRSGLETVFGCGFTYSVSGYFTFEYSGVKNADYLVNTMQTKVKSGQIYIFHLDDMPAFIPVALDRYLTKMEDSRKQWNFVSLAEVLD